MKERPILFSGPMVRAILAGTKTQTRRVVKRTSDGGQAVYTHPQWIVRPTVSPRFNGHSHDFWLPNASVAYSALPKCPYGKPGDRLWVRETWCVASPFDRTKPSEIPPGQVLGCRADGEFPLAAGKWRPGMFMPRWASRITLEITGVRVERLQDISEADAMAEGCALECMRPTGDDNGSAIHGPGGYTALWESINGHGSWEANPWVWVVEFRKATA